MTDEIPSSRDRAEKLLDTITEMEKEFDKVVAENKELSETGAACYDSMMKKNGEIIELERRKKRAENMCARLAGTNDKLQAENEALYRQIKDGLDDKDDLRDENEKLKAVVEVAKHVMPDLCGPCDRMTRKLNEAMESLE